MRRQGDGISRAFPKGPKQLPAQGNASLASLFSKLGVIDDLSMQRVEVTTTHALESRLAIACTLAKSASSPSPCVSNTVSMKVTSDQCAWLIGRDESCSSTNSSAAAVISFRECSPAANLSRGRV